MTVLRHRVLSGTSKWMVSSNERSAITPITLWSREQVSKPTNRVSSFLEARLRLRRDQTFGNSPLGLVDGSGRCVK
jgi:hypothetical protein